MTEAMQVLKVSRDYRMRSVVRIGDVKIGGEFVVIAGPCSVESPQQIMKTAEFLSEIGVKILRGGAYKPRTSPYSFQGFGEEALRWMRRAADEYDMLVVSEVMDTRKVPLVENYVDIIQVGSRNCQNYELLREVGRSDKPVLLKRGFGNTIEEWLYAAEYILFEGNENVILCERGIRTFEKVTRFTLDISAVPVLKELSHLPVIVDPSHAAGRRSLILPLSKAALAVGADGIMVEVHPEPEKALSDGRQSLNFQEFAELMEAMKKWSLLSDGGL